MRPNRNRAKGKKPIKKHRDGYTGQRAKNLKEHNKPREVNKCKKLLEKKQSKFSKQELTTLAASRESILKLLKMTKS